ncbi:MAG TPA: ABC transporter permease [Acidimicrobiales bacterium]
MKYVGRKLVRLIVVVLAVTMLTFLLMSFLPGDKAIAIGGPGRSEEEYDQIRKDWGLNKPLPIRYVTWLGNTVRGDMGVSSAFNVPVSQLIKDRLPVSLYLMLYGLSLGLLISIPLGILAAYQANRPVDRLLNTGAFGLLSVPNFVMAVLLVFLFALRLQWFPAISEYIAPWDDPIAHIRNFFLPVLAIAIGEIAVFMRLLRSDMVGTLQNDFITLARSKGMTSSHILMRHAFRPSTFSLITAAAVNVGALIGGTIVVEQTFALPGMGNLIVEAIARRDFLVVQMCVVVFSIIFVVANFTVDLLYAAIDPRIRHARALG